MAFPLNKETEAISLPQPQRGTNNGTLAWRDAAGPLLASAERTQVLREKRSSAMSATA